MPLSLGTGENSSQEKDGPGGISSNPNNIGGREEIFQWDARLKEALRFEDYETAAVCRDKIRELKKGYETNA